MNIITLISIILFSITGITKNIIYNFCEQNEKEEFVSKKIENIAFILNILFILSTITGGISLFL